MTDYTGEKLIHSLLMLVPLRARMWQSTEEISRNVLTDFVEDLAKGTISHLLTNQKVEFSVWKARLNEFVDAIQNASTRAEALAVFAKIKEIASYWQHPYFDDSDVTTLYDAREKETTRHEDDEGRS